MSGAYYNEFDPFAAQTLRNLIAKGLIAPGDVDERSIEDVHPDDLRGYTQCHFFAGIGAWSLALRNAGWDDDTRVWTGSCPCQPFSAAGKGDGFTDERHLWPAFFHLITQCEPPTVFGEQVASSHVNPWIELVQDDMEALGHRFAAVAFPSASVGAPHIRDRTFWVAHAHDTGSQGHRGPIDQHGSEGWEGAQRCVGASGLDERLEHPKSYGRIAWGTEPSGRSTSSGCGTSGVGNTCSKPVRTVSGGLEPTTREEHREAPERKWCGNAGISSSSIDNTNTTHPHWRDADWLYCRDSKWRPVEPGTSPLAHGLTRSMGALDAGVRGLAEMAGLDATSLRRAKSYRVGSLKAYGNAINAVQAEQFIRAYLDA